MPFLDQLSQSSGLVGVPLYRRLDTEADSGDEGEAATPQHTRREEDAPQVTPVPLEGVDLKVRVISTSAQVEVIQNYVNKEKDPIECIYFFPIEEEAAVVKFTAELAGRTIKTAIKESELAKQEYRKALEDKKTAVTMSEVKPDIFQLKIGQLAPEEKCKITFTYISELPIEEDSVRLTIPTTIAPRYIPDNDKSKAAKKIAEIAHDDISPAQLSLDLNILMKTEIKNIKSPSHKLTTAEKNVRGAYFEANTKFEGSTTDMDRDLVVLVSSEETNKPKLLVEHDVETNSHLALLSFVPKFEIKQQRIEAVFLVDCSGSMGGTSMVLAKEALQVFLNSLPVESYFNIILFGSSFRSLYTESKKYDSRTLEEAKIFSKGIEANLGGTNIFEPLESIFKQQEVIEEKETIRRQVFVLTDGQVSNTAACIELVNRHSSTSRVYTLGIGYGADRHLVGGMARAGEGTAVYTTQGESITPKVVQQLKDSLQPGVSKVEIKWGKLEAEKSNNKHDMDQAPARVPSVFNGKRMVIYKLLKEKIERDREVVFTAHFGDQTMEEKLVVEPKSFITGSQLHKLYARKKIQEVSEDSEINYRDKQEIVTSLGLKYSLITAHTSFIGVDERVQEGQGQMQSRQVKNMLLKNSTPETVSNGQLPIHTPGGDNFMYYMSGPSAGESMPRGGGAIRASNVKKGSGLGFLGLGSYFSGMAGKMTSSKGSSSSHSSYSGSEAPRGGGSRGAGYDQPRGAPGGARSHPRGSVSPTRGGGGKTKKPTKTNETETKKKKEKIVIAITSFQESDGSFNPGTELSKTIGASLTDWIGKMSSRSQQMSAVLTTFVVITLLRENFKENKDVWELVVEKSAIWLQNNNLKLTSEQRSDANMFIKKCGESINMKG